jgi:hypothetical protein
MSIVRKLFGIVLLVMMFVSVSSASATGNSTTTRQIIRNPVSFTMTPAQCSRLKVPVSGAGQLYEVIATTTHSDGSIHITDDALILGRAWDSTGNYRFVYANHFVQDIPAGSGPVQAFMIDTFTLTGHGSAAGLRNGFVWKWNFTKGAPNFPPEFNLQQILTFGDPITPAGESHCDPL